MDWLALLDDHHIPYVTRGPNTARGEVSIKCPYCGDDDPSTHLGINLSTGYWGCLRSMEHRGKGAGRLLRALLGCSAYQVDSLIAQYSVPDVDSLPSLEATSDAPTPLQAPITLPPECRNIVNYTLTKKFWVYLRERGYAPTEVDQLIELYGLKGCLTGTYKNRIIIPVYTDGKLVGWQARVIGNANGAPKFLVSGPEIKETVFNADVQGDVLYVCEGPFDAIRVDYIGKDWGHRACCTYGVNATPRQISTINIMAKRFKQVVILFDNDSAGLAAAWQLIDWLPSNTTIGSLPENIKDPGELSKLQILEMIRKK